MADISEHQRQIRENLAYWQAKPVLREIYREFHRRIAAHLSPAEGETVEIGSGIGNIRDVVPYCVRTDLFPNPWIDRVENIYCLSMRDESVANIILFDVFHHLRFPLDALDECRRVLKPGGRLLVFDHAMSLAGLLFSRFLHHEKAGFLKPLTPRAPAGVDPSRSGYYADHANAHRVFVRGYHKFLADAWRRVCLERFPALPWLFSGGYRGPSMVGPRTSGLIKAADHAASRLPSITALRLLVVMERA